MKKFNLNVKYEIFERFSNVCINQKEKPQKKLEKMMIEHIASSIKFDDKIFYQLKADTDCEPVRITKREGNFLILDNGNKIHVFDFEKIFEGIDPIVKEVLDEIKNNDSKDLDTVDPETFLKRDNAILEDIANSIKNINTKTIVE